MKHIVLLADDPKVTGQISSLLPAEYTLENFSTFEQAQPQIAKNCPDLVIIDYDLKPEDGLKVYRKFLSSCPQIKVIMLSSANDVSLAVTATKLGVDNFLRKPLNAEDFNQVIQNALDKGQTALALNLAELDNVEWLYGSSPLNTRLLKALEEAAHSEADVMLMAEKGVDLRRAAELVHRSSCRRRRRFIELDLSAFSEASEPYFWSTLQELLSRRDDPADRAGTIYFSGLLSVPDHFRASFLDFLAQSRVNPRFEASIRFMLGLPRESEEKIKLANYNKINLPSLREKKEDLPVITDKYLRKYARKYQKKIFHFSTEIVSFLSYYAFPGNFEELQNILEQAVLACEEESLSLKDLPVNWKLLSLVVSQKSFSVLDFSLQGLHHALEQAAKQPAWSSVLR